MALILWCVLAFVVFMARFDWQTKEVAQQFAMEQLARSEQGRPVTTINEGFRPRVRAEARRAGIWGGLILVTGLAGAVWASRSSAVR